MRPSTRRSRPSASRPKARRAQKRNGSAEAWLEPLEGPPPTAIERRVLDRLQERAVVVVQLVADHGRLGGEVDVDDLGHQQVRRAAEPDLARFWNRFDVQSRHGSLDTPAFDAKTE